MFLLAVALWQLGYALIYTGVANIANGGQGPKFGESLGLKFPVASPSRQQPNLSGQPPASVGGAGSAGGGGGGSWS